MPVVSSDRLGRSVLLPSLPLRWDPCRIRSASSSPPPLRDDPSRGPLRPRPDCQNSSGPAPPTGGVQGGCRSALEFNWRTAAAERRGFSAVFAIRPRSATSDPSAASSLVQAFVAGIRRRAASGARARSYGAAPVRAAQRSVTERCQEPSRPAEGARDGASEPAASVALRRDLPQARRTHAPDTPTGEGRTERRPAPPPSGTRCESKLSRPPPVGG